MRRAPQPAPPGVAGLHLADQLVSITPVGGTAATFRSDALGRLLSRTIGGLPEGYAYQDVSEAVARIQTGPTSYVEALLGSDGERLGVGSGSSFGWLVPDLHGSVAASYDASETAVRDAFRYDAYGALAAQWPTGGSSVPTRWRYQGQLSIQPAGAPELYENGARYLAPGLGAFTQLDSVMGSGTVRCP